MLVLANSTLLHTIYNQNVRTNIAESRLHFLKGSLHTLCFPDCSTCLNCSHRTTLMSSFALEDRLLSCHLPLSSEAIAARGKPCIA